MISIDESDILPQGLPDHCFNTFAKSIWSLFWILYVFFLIQGAYKCNLRAYMMIKDYEPVVDTAEVGEHQSDMRGSSRLRSSLFLGKVCRIGQTSML